MTFIRLKREAEELKKHIRAKYDGAKKTTIVEMLGSDDPLIKEYSDFLFENDYSLYTAKQWGISPSKIDVSVLKRVPVLFFWHLKKFCVKAIPKRQREACKASGIGDFLLIAIPLQSVIFTFAGYSQSG